VKRIICITVFIITLLTGCRDGDPLPLHMEIDDIDLIKVIAVDRCEDYRMVKVTVTFQKAAAGSTEQEGSTRGNEQVIVLSALNETVQAAIRQFQTYTNNRVFWGHTDFYLIGEEAAKEDIVRYLDFFTRDHDFRPNSKVFVTYGKAGDILEESNLPGFFIADYLESLEENTKLLSRSGSLRMLQLMHELDENTTFGIAIPAISLDGELVKAKGTDFPLNKAVKVEGYAIIKNFKLAGFISQSDSRGYNIIKNIASRGMIGITDQSGKNLGVEIIGVRSKVIPVIKNGQVTGVRIKTWLETNVDEVQSRKDVFTEDSLTYLEQQQAEVIKKEMENCVKLAKDLDCDFLGIGKAVHLRHPIVWNRIKDHWDEIFQELDIEFEIESHINRTYDIREPNGYRAGGQN
jgi:spore germination protein KC